MPQSRNGSYAHAGQEQTQDAPDVDAEALRKVNAVEHRTHGRQEEDARRGTAVEETAEGTQDEGSVKDLLGEAFKKVTDEIEFCDEQIEKYESKKAELQAQIQTAMQELQSQFGKKVSAPRGRPPQKASRGSTNGEPRNTGRGGTKSTRALITEYLEDVGQATTAEIRTFLEDSGKETNPGVELSRMVKDKSIRNITRGVYAIGRR